MGREDTYKSRKTVVLGPVNPQKKDGAQNAKFHCGKRGLGRKEGKKRVKVEGSNRTLHIESFEGEIIILPTWRENYGGEECVGKN